MGVRCSEQKGVEAAAQAGEKREAVVVARMAGEVGASEVMCAGLVGLSLA